MMIMICSSSTALSFVGSYLDCGVSVEHFFSRSLGGLVKAQKMHGNVDWYCLQYFISA